MLDPVYKDKIIEAISQYFNINKGSVSEAATLWEAFKATIRGTCISRAVGILKDIRGNMRGWRLHLNNSSGNKKPDRMQTH